MSRVEGTGWCAQCHEQRLTYRKGTNHVLHLILTLVTLGLWGIVWIVVALLNRGNTNRCSVCGAPTVRISQRPRDDERPAEAGP